jgi:serine/threonine-protein kinase
VDPEEDPTRGARAPSAARDSVDAEALHPAPGDRIGRFIVRELIAEGGMGMVFAADDPELGRVVAIKLLHPALGGPAEEQKHRLLREAQAMARGG